MRLPDPVCPSSSTHKLCSRTLARIAAAAAATAIGGAPATDTRVKRHFIYHTYTHCSPIPHTVEQAPMQLRIGLNAEATPGTPPGPEGPPHRALAQHAGGRRRQMRARMPALSNPTALQPIAQSRAMPNPIAAPRRCCTHQTPHGRTTAVPHTDSASSLARERLTNRAARQQANHASCPDLVPNGLHSPSLP